MSSTIKVHPDDGNHGESPEHKKEIRIYINTREFLVRKPHPQSAFTQRISGTSPLTVLWCQRPPRKLWNIWRSLQGSWPWRP